MKRTTKKQTQKTEKKEYKSNVIQFSSVQKTKNGYAIFLGKNVIFLHTNLLKYIDKKKAA